MDKSQVLSAISELASKKQITKDELRAAYSKGLGEGGASFQHVSISEALYYIGALIVFIGIATFLNQNWSSLSIVTRIVTTLGSAVISYIVGVSFNQKKDTQSVSLAFFFLSAILFPIGIAVTFNEAGFDIETSGMLSAITGIPLAIFAVSYFIFKRNVFIVSSIAFGTLFFFAFTNTLLEDTAIYDGWKFHNYRVLLVAISYLLMGYYYDTIRQERLSDALYTLGAIGFLGAALFLGGWKDSSTFNVLWQLLFPFLVAGFIYASVAIKAKSFLLISSFFLMVYIIKITAEHFSENLGWPLALILSGLMVIAIGFATLRINKKYLKS